VGYEGALKRLLADLFNQHNNDPDIVQLGWAQREDMFKTYILEQQRLKKEKIWWTAEKKLKLKAQREDNMLVRNKGDFYSQGLALQSAMMVENDTNEPVCFHVGGGKQTTPTKCKCGLMDHLKISYRKYKLNPKNVALRAKAAVEEAAKMQQLGIYRLN